MLYLVSLLQNQPQATRRHFWGSYSFYQECGQKNKMVFLIVITIILTIFVFIGFVVKKSIPTEPGPQCPPVSFSTDIEFGASGFGGLLTDSDITELVDALTGAPLRLNEGLFQCRRCHVFYQDQSVKVIRAENGGRCVSCFQAELVRVMDRRKQHLRQAEVDAVTHYKYRSYLALSHGNNSSPGDEQKGNFIACVI